MAKRRKSRTRLISARSELRKGFSMPTQSKIKSALGSRSKSFVVNLLLFAMKFLTKTQKIKVLMRIEGLKTSRTRRRKTKRRSSTRRRKSRGRRKSKTRRRRTGRLKKGSAAAKAKMRKVRAARKRRR